MIFTQASLLVLALQCLPPKLAPVAVGFAMQENPGLDSTAIGHNPNGTTDFGLGQINSRNFPWLSVAMGRTINAQTILDPCTNLQASVRVLFARYNGNPPDILKAKYANGVIARIDSTAALPPPLDDDPGINDEPGQQGETIFTGEK